MWTKSKIQLIKESYEALSNCKNYINDLMDKYIIEDNIFMYSNGKLVEATKGYFEKISEFDNLDEALNINNFQFDKMGVRIIENKKFEIGYLRNLLSECDKNSQIYDIDIQSNIE